MSDSLDDVKKRILGRVTLAQLIGETVSLETRSGRPVGLCPFHNEKSPSFNLYDDHFYCFGCKKNGDAIDFVRETQGLGFVDALRYLAGKYGIEVPELDASRNRDGRRRQDVSLFKMMAEAQEFYVAALRTPHGKPALDYLLSRGFTPEHIAAWGFGMTPAEGFGLVRHLRAKGYREDDMAACSLATASVRDGRSFDFLRTRLTLPIADQQGRIIGFGGRTLDGAHPKYLNSRDSKLFDKSRTLFGFDKARSRMRERGRAILVEGYMDTLQLWQAGLPEVVACMGTAFTEHQLKLLRHATGQLILLFDGDTAGQKATLAAVNIALTVPEVHVRAVSLSAGEDPDSFVRKFGLEALEAELDKAVDLLDFAVGERLKSTPSLAIPSVVSNEFVPWLAHVSDRLQRSYLIGRIANLTGIPASHIESQLHGSTKAAPRRQSAAAKSSAEESQAEAVKAQLVPWPPLDLTGFDLFGHLYHAQPGELNTKTVMEVVRQDFDFGGEHFALLGEFCAALERGEAPSAQPDHAWSLSLDPEGAALLARLHAAAPAFTCQNRKGSVAQVIGYVRQRRVKQTISRLKTEMSRAAVDPSRRGEVNDILKTIHELTRPPAAVALD